MALSKGFTAGTAAALAAAGAKRPLAQAGGQAKSKKGRLQVPSGWTTIEHAVPAATAPSESAATTDASSASASAGGSASGGGADTGAASEIRIVLWDLDETLIVFNSLLTRQFCAATRCVAIYRVVLTAAARHWCTKKCVDLST